VRAPKRAPVPLPPELAASPGSRLARMYRIAQPLIDRLEAEIASRAAAREAEAAAIKAARRAARLERKRIAARRKAGGRAVKCSMCGLPAHRDIANCKSNWAPQAVQPLGADEEEGRIWNSKWVAAPVAPVAPVELPKYLPRMPHQRSAKA